MTRADVDERQHTEADAASGDAEAAAAAAERATADDASSSTAPTGDGSGGLRATDDAEAAAAVPEARRAAALEAVLLTMDKPASAGKLAGALGLEGALPEQTLQPLIESLNAAYEQTGRSFRIEKVAGGYRIMTLPEFAGPVATAHGLQSSTKLSRAAIETLAIVAYQQPITRASIEAIRGVACGEVLRTLLEKKLITITGRAEELGRPMLYGTTSRFLEAFGLASINDLPKVGDLFPGVDAAALDGGGAGPPGGRPADDRSNDSAPEAEDAADETGHDGETTPAVGDPGTADGPRDAGDPDGTGAASGSLDEADGDSAAGAENTETDR